MAAEESLAAEEVSAAVAEAKSAVFDDVEGMCRSHVGSRIGCASCHSLDSSCSVFPSSPVNMKRDASWYQPSDRPPQVTQEFIDNHTRTLIDHMGILHTASERKLSELKYMANLRERLAADTKRKTSTAIGSADRLGLNSLVARK